MYFESFTGDELKQPGYSKDARFKECQILLALAVTETGLPVRYTVLPGARLKSLPQAARTQVLDEDRYETLQDSNGTRVLGSGFSHRLRADGC